MPAPQSPYEPGDGDVLLAGGRVLECPAPAPQNAAVTRLQTYAPSDIALGYDDVVFFDHAGDLYGGVPRSVRCGAGRSGVAVDRAQPDGDQCEKHRRRPPPHDHAWSAAP